MTLQEKINRLACAGYIVIDDEYGCSIHDLLDSSNGFALGGVDRVKVISEAYEHLIHD